MRLFLDANDLFVAGYSATNSVHDLLALASGGFCDLLSSEYAFEEARRNLAIKGQPSMLERFTTSTLGIVRVSEAGAPALAQATAADMSDPADIPILAAAIQARADGLVTGDKRAFSPHFGTRIAAVEIMLLRDALQRVTS